MSIAIQTTPHFNWERALIPARQRNIETRLNDIISRNVLTPQDVPTIKSALRISNGWTIWSGRVSSLLRQIDEKVILDFLSEVSKAPAGKEASFFIEKSLSFLSTQGLLDLSGLGNTEDAVVRYNADALTRPTVAQLAIVRKTIKLVKEFWIELKYFIHHMMDLCIGATGLNTLVRPKHHRWETSSVPTNEYVAMNQMKSYQTLLYSPTLLFGLIYAYVAIKTAAVAATAIAAVGIVALSIGYQRYWKPCPIDHEGLKNLSIAMLRQQEPNYVRQDILDQIQAAFESKKGVLLVGEPGVGKTWIAQSLAQQLNEGKLCTFIKDPHMFSCNGATLKSISEISPLQGIETRFEQHAENVVFFIDEFHAIFDEKEALKTGASTELKTFCHTFRYVIGATTQSEYDEHVKEKIAVIDRRIVKIQVGPLEEDKVGISLSQYMKVLHPELDREDDIHDYIAHNAKRYNPKTSQIDAAHSLLSVAINMMTTIPYSDLEKEIANLNDQIGVITTKIQGRGARGVVLKTLTTNLGNCQRNLEEKQEELRIRRAKAGRLQSMERELLRLKSEGYALADPNRALVEGTALERAWLTVHSKIAVMSREVLRLRDELQLPARIDRSLVEQIIAKKTAPENN